MLIQLTKTDGSSVLVSGITRVETREPEGSKIFMGGDSLDVKEAPNRIREMVNANPVKI